MKSGKKLLLMILTVCLILGLAGTAFAANLSDLDGHWAKAEIENWVEQELAAGYPDETFKPDNKISRAEFVSLVNRAFKVQNSVAEGIFVDVKSIDWFYKDVTAAKAAGYISGYENNTFKPYQEISRQEVASIVARLLKLDTSNDLTALDNFVDAEDIPAWSRAVVNAVVESGIINGYPDKTVKPFNSITRAEAIVTLNSAVNYKVPEPVVTVKPGIEGKVLYNSKAVKGVTINLFEKDSYQVVKETKTNLEGKFKLDLEPGVYDLTATTDETVAYASGLIVTKDQVVSQELTLEKAAIVTGKLYDKNNNAAEKVKVIFTTNPTFVTTTDEDGEYTLALLPERKYKVRAVNPDNDEIEVLKESLDIDSAGQQQKISSFNTSFAVGSSTPSGSATGDVDEPPFITDASITIQDGEPKVCRPIGGITGGVKAEIILQGSPEATITGGRIAVSEDAILTITSPSLLAGNYQELKKGDNPLKSIDALAGISASFDFNFLNQFTDGDVTIKGQLVDESGQKSNVELKILIEVR